MMTLYEVLRASKQNCYRVFVGHSCGCLRLYPNKNGPLLDIDRYLTESWWKSISHSIMQYYIYIYICIYIFIYLFIYLFIYIYTGTFIFLVPLLMFLQLSSCYQWLLTTTILPCLQLPIIRYVINLPKPWSPKPSKNFANCAQELDIFYWSAGDATRECSLKRPCFLKPGEWKYMDI